MNSHEMRDFVLPSAPSKTLWFEFLFVDGLLERHLDQPQPDPSAADLVSEFLAHAQSASQASAAQAAAQSRADLVNGTNGTDRPSTEAAEKSKKEWLLQLLATKTGCEWRWDVQLLEQRVPASKAWALISCLRSLTRSAHDVRLLSDVVAARFLLRALAKQACPSRPTPDRATDTGLQQQLQQEAPAVMAVAQQLLRQQPPPATLALPTSACFRVRSPHLDWTRAEAVAAEPLLHALRFDLSRYLFVRSQYEEVAAGAPAARH